MGSLDKNSKIFVNRSLNMGSITSIGFDMDHTLARYHRENFENLAFRKTVEKFIEAGYPEELSRLNFDPKFVIRGLLVDRERGNLLKVDSHKYAKVAYHGHQRLDKSERHQIYNAKGFKADSFLSVDTFFALSEVQLFTEIVDYMRRHPGSIQKSYEEVYRDLRWFIDLSHHDGSIKSEVIAHPEKYIVKDPDVSDMLIRLIEGGKKIFLLTNSDWSYTNNVMTYLLDGVADDFKRWSDYFEYVIVSSNKPTFFTGSNPFYEIVDEKGLLKEHHGALQVGGFYHGGNAQLFERLTKQSGDQILYIGDHIFGDIMRSKEHLNWRTLLVIEELSEEFNTLEQTRSEMIKILELIEKEEDLQSEAHNIRGHLDLLSRRASTPGAPKVDSTRQKQLQTKLKQLEADHEEIHTRIKSLVTDREKGFHPVWGELMHSGLEKSRFAQQLESYACLYATKATNLLHYSPNKKFRSMRDSLPHEL